jgi:magnesium-transporting ATPase (P-type)
LERSIDETTGAASVPIPLLDIKAIIDLHAIPVPEVYKKLGSRPEGLTEAEVKERQNQFGRNSIIKVKGKPLILKLLANFTHLMALLLWIGGLVGFIAKMPQLGLAIWTVNLINGVFSFWQEYKAEKATEALLRLLPPNARVIRDGAEKSVLAEELVPGDLILLAEGDRISADGRIVEAAELRVDQSTLTGEAQPVAKTGEAELRTGMTRAEVPDLVFAGTSVASGTGKAVVFTTGMNTEFGKIAHLTQTIVDAPSPLQRELDRVTKVVTAMAMGIGILFFFLAVFLAGVNLAVSFIFAMGMIVAFVPEGLLPTVTLSLAMGVQRMAKRNALIKKLSAVETLGCTTVICTDKTGTLTENEMTVRALWVAGQRLSVTGVGYEAEGQILAEDQPIPSPTDGDLRQMLIAAGLCNDSRLLAPIDGSNHWTELGDPTEAALRVVALKGGVNLDDELSHTPRLRELPFDSHRKRMSTVHQGPEGTSIAYVKGAPKEILALSTDIQINSQIAPLAEDLRAQIVAINDEYARSGLRVLAIAQRLLPCGPGAPKPETIERDLTFLGLIAMMDPPRPEAAEAVRKCHQAGIRIIMITGDYGLTAESIARNIGIIKDFPAQIITGPELEQMSDEVLKGHLAGEVIFARVAPEQKLRVVTALKEMGQVVAVTGDGVNDAPALKQADIGIAMGMTGTDVAKEAADMILTDDNFASIVNAIEEGRAVYANIRKFAMYVFNSNMAEAVPFIVMLFSRGGIPLPLTVMQVLAIDLGTDMLPAIGLGSESPEAGIMDRPPRSREEPLLNRPLIVRALFWYGLIESVAAMSAYFFLNWQHGWPGVVLAQEGTLAYRMATTMTFATIVATQVGAVLGCRTDRVSVFKIGLFSNRLILGGIAVELCILGLLMYVPFLQKAFNTAPFGLIEWVFVLSWIPIVFLVDELRKALLRWREQHRAP